MKTISISTAIPVTIAIGLLLWGSINLSTLSSAYQVTDIARSENPASYRMWQTKIFSENRAAPEKIVSQVANRFLLMSLENRREIALAVSQRGYWQAMPIPHTEQLELISATLSGSLNALKSAPSAAELWLLAANLEIRLNGYSKNAQNYIHTSRLFSPNEMDLVRERIVMAAFTWRLMNARDQEGLRADLSSLQRNQPTAMERIKKELQAAGVEFDH